MEKRFYFFKNCNNRRNKKSCPNNLRNTQVNEECKEDIKNYYEKKMAKLIDNKLIMKQDFELKKIKFVYDYYNKYNNNNIINNNEKEKSQLDDNKKIRKQEFESQKKELILKLNYSYNNNHKKKWETC